jgi:protein-tyrosine phosphatase
MGISRSAAVIAAYLMRRFEWCATEAIAYIRRSRFVE